MRLAYHERLRTQRRPYHTEVAMSTNPLNFLAFDLGAESGRAILGQFDGERLASPKSIASPTARSGAAAGRGLHWDVLRLWNEIKQGHGAGRARYGATGRHRPGHLGRGFRPARPARRAGRQPLSLPRQPDRRHAGGGLPRVPPRGEIFEQTGIQFMQINTLYQLLSMVVSGVARRWTRPTPS